MVKDGVKSKYEQLKEGGKQHRWRVYTRESVREEMLRVPEYLKNGYAVGGNEIMLWMLKYLRE